MPDNNNPNPSLELFDKELIGRRLNLRKTPDDNFVLDIVIEDLHERLAPIKREFKNALIMGANPNLLPKSSATAIAKISFNQASTIIKNNDFIFLDVENLKFPKNNYDLIISLLDLQTINNVPQFLKQIRLSLAPDGFMLIGAIGGSSLSELRYAWLKADEEMMGGAYARVAPFIDVKSAGSLLQNAGFALPMADIDNHKVRYSSALSLMKEIKAYGASNPLKQKPNKQISKTHLASACAIYDDMFSDEDERIRASLDILWLSGWAAHESQQKPLAPGSAQVSLTKILTKK